MIDLRAAVLMEEQLVAAERKFEELARDLPDLERRYDTLQAAEQQAATALEEVQERCMTAEAGLAKREEVLQSLASEVDAMVADAERGGGPQSHGETTVGWGSIRRIHQLLTDV